MENLVLIIGGLFNSFSWGDLFFFVATLFLIIFMIYMFYMIKEEETDVEEQNLKVSPSVPTIKPQEEKSLSKIVNELQTEYKPTPIDLSDYEREMEDTAIISYQELVSRANNNIYYDDNYDSGFDDVLIQKIDNKESKTQELVDLPKAVMMSYESEEAFLRALKVLQKNLVR